MDANDPMTADAAALDGTDFTTFPDDDTLQGRRVGIYVGVAKPASLPDPLSADTVADLLKQHGLDAGAAGLAAAWHSASPPLMTFVKRNVTYRNHDGNEVMRSQSQHPAMDSLVSVVPFLLLITAIITVAAWVIGPDEVPTPPSD